MRLENKIFRLSSQHIANMDNRQLINKRIITIPALMELTGLKMCRAVGKRPKRFKIIWKTNKFLIFYIGNKSYLSND